VDRYTAELFKLVSDGHLRLARWKDNGYPFTSEGLRQAHRDISGRGTMGKLIVQIA
jgi:NADPH2:quinone reductase